MRYTIEEEDEYAGSCDMCGTPLDPEDASIHLCKVCQGMQDEE